MKIPQIQPGLGISVSKYADSSGDYHPRLAPRTLPRPVGERSSILDCVGNTPLVRLNHLFERSDVTVFAKMEMLNPGGSIKDRTAVSLLRDGLRRGVLTPRSRVVESSSGNLGIGLALSCRQLGLRLTVVVDARTNPEVVRLVTAFGGEIEVVEAQSDDESLLDARLRRVAEIVDQDPDAVWLNQYANEANPRAHHETMGEIIEQVGGKLDHFYVATSTCGTLVGCRESLVAHQLSAQVTAVDSSGSVIFQSRDAALNEKRHLPGHGSSRNSDFLEDNHYDKVHLVSDMDCVSGCRQLLAREGIMAGGSSGGVVSALQRDIESVPSESVVVILLCDRGERYLDTIYNDEWVERTLNQTPQ